MKLVVQRVSSASVAVEGKIVGQIHKGAVVLIGICSSDTKEEARFLAGKLAHLRFFEDSSHKMNASLLDCKGEVLIISQFTLYGDCSEGRRPSFTKAAPGAFAEPLYNSFIEEVKKLGLRVQTGVFGAHMEICLTNDGPVTLILDKRHSSS